MHEPMDVLHQFPVRKTKAQKETFRAAVRQYVSELGYGVQEEEGSFGCRNLVIGDPQKAKYLVTAHYDTCARMLIPNLITPCNLFWFLLYQILLVMLLMIPMLLGAVLGGAMQTPLIFWLGYVLFWINLAMLLVGPANPSNANDNTSGVVTLLEIARTMPENQRDKVCFVLFDLEEAGLIGSAAYRKTHRKETDRQIVLNLDCVGDGDELLMFLTKRMKKDRRKLASLYKACGYFGKKSLLVWEKGFSIYPSDQMQFPWGVGICALRKSRFGLYMGRIHTPRDTVLEPTNVNILRAALTTFICCDEVN